MSGFIILVLCSSLSLFAEDTLDRIDVSAEKLAAPVYFGTTEMVSKDELEARPLPQISQALERVPGIISSQNGGTGSRTSFFIRGTESRHVSFTLDGLKLNDPSNTDRQFDAAFLTVAPLSEIYVHKGPQAILFGSDAMGGHVEMLSRSGFAAPSGKATIHYGSFETRGATVTKDWRKESHQGTVSVVNSRSNGISRLNKKRFDASERDSSETSQLTTSSLHHFGSRVDTKLLASFIRGQNELDGALSDNKNDRSTNDQILLQQRTALTLKKDQVLSLRNGINRHQRSLKTLAVGSESFSGNSYQNEVFFKSRELSAGLMLERETFDSSGSDNQFDLWSAYLQGLKKLGRFELQAGLRADHHSRYGNFLTGSAGLRIELTRTQKLFLQYANGYKAPSLYQLYAPAFLGLQIANPDLKPESNQSFELGHKWTSDVFDLETTLFRNHLSNLITYTSAGYRNQGRFQVEGAEVSAVLKSEKNRIRSSFTHQAFTEETSPILRRPQNMATVAWSYYPQDRTELFLTGRWFAAREDLDPTSFTGATVKLNSFETYDLGVHQDFGPLDGSLQVINLLNRDYEEIYGASVLPRSIFGSVGYKF